MRFPSHFFPSTSLHRPWQTNHRRKQPQPLFLLLPLLLLLLLLCLPFGCGQSATYPSTIPVSLIPTAAFSTSLSPRGFPGTPTSNAVPNPATFSLIVVLDLFSELGIDDSLAVEPNFTPQLQEVGYESLVTTYIAGQLLSSHSYYTYVINDSNSLTNYSLSATIQLQFEDGGCDPTISTTNVIEGLAAVPNSLGLVGPGCTVATQPAAIIASYNGLPTISYAASGDDLNNKATYPTFTRTAPDVASTLSAVVPVLQQWSWQHLVVLVELDYLQQGLLQDLQQQFSAATPELQFLVESYQAGQTDLASLSPLLVSAAQSGYMAFLVHGSDTSDCVNLLIAAANHSLITDSSIWIIHPDCAIDTVLTQPISLNATTNTTVAGLMQGQLFYFSAVPDPQQPLLVALTQSYHFLRSLNQSLWGGIPLPVSPTPSYTSLLAFDAMMTYLLSFQALLTEGIFPSKTRGPSLTAVIDVIEFTGVTGLVNFSVDTGRRYGLGWTLGQILSDGTTLDLGYITLTGELTSSVEDGTASTLSYPVSQLSLNGSVIPQWAGGVIPRDLLLDSTSSSHVGESVGIVVGSIIGAALLLLGCVLCVGMVRRNVTRNAEILREAKEEAMRSKEEAELADALKSQFLSTMSHEIRTPMNGVFGNNSLLASTPLTPEQIEYVEGITVSTDHLLTVINDILDWQSMESGRMDLDIAVVRLASIVEQAINISYRPAFSSHLEVVTFIDPSLPEYIIGDQTRLRQILANLLSNSLKFSNAHSGQITIIVCPTGQQPAIRPLVPLPISPAIEGMLMVGEGLWWEDSLDETTIGRVVADVAVLERGRAEKEDRERAERLREEKKLKRRIQTLLSKLKEKKEAQGGEAASTFPDHALVEERKQRAPPSKLQQGKAAEVEMASTPKPADDFIITVDTDSTAASVSVPSTSILYPPSSLEHLSIQCTIEDQGVGISAENQRKLFSRFSQVHVGYPGGTGLGLAISMFLSQLMGGTMWVVSKVGVGSRFGFSFVSTVDPNLIASTTRSAEQHTPDHRDPHSSSAPAHDTHTESLAAEGRPILPASPEIARSSAYSPLPSGPSTPTRMNGNGGASLICFPRLPKPQLGLNILIVDDNPSLLRLTSSTLTSWGCTVFCALSVHAAMSFVCAVYKLPMQALRMEEGEGGSPGGLTELELPGSASDGSPRSNSALSVAIPSKLDVIMIDYHLQAKERVERVGEKGGEERKEMEDVDVGAKLNGMQLARAIHTRLTAQHRKRVLKTATEVFVSASSISPLSPPSSIQSSPTQLRRRLVNPKASSRTLLNQPIQENSASSSAHTSPLLTSSTQPPALSRPLSFPDKVLAKSIAPLSSSSPLLHTDRLSLSLQHNVPVLLLMVGLAEEASLATHHSPQREACLTGKLRKPLSETQMLRALQMVKSKQREVEDERAREAAKRDAQGMPGSFIKDLRSTSAPAQHVRPNGVTATSPSSSSPQTSPTSAPAAITSPAARHLIAHRYPLKLLYAEDNLVNQRLLSRMLTKYGYSTVIAENGQVALDLLAKEVKEGRAQFDLVWMDMQMPVMGGVEASRCIRELYGAERPVIVGVTANAMESDKQKCLEVMDDYLSKPVSFAVLEQALLKWGLRIAQKREKKSSRKAAELGSPHSADLSDPASRTSLSTTPTSTTPHGKEEHARPSIFAAPLTGLQEEEKQAADPSPDGPSLSASPTHRLQNAAPAVLSLSLSPGSALGHASHSLSEPWPSPADLVTAGTTASTLPLAEGWKRFTSGGSIASTSTQSPSQREDTAGSMQLNAVSMSPASDTQVTVNDAPRKGSEG